MNRHARNALNALYWLAVVAFGLYAVALFYAPVYNAEPGHKAFIAGVPSGGGKKPTRAGEYLPGAQQARQASFICPTVEAYRGAEHAKELGDIIGFNRTRGIVFCEKGTEVLVLDRSWFSRMAQVRILDPGHPSFGEAGWLPANQLSGAHTR